MRHLSSFQCSPDSLWGRSVPLCRKSLTAPGTSLWPVCATSPVRGAAFTDRRGAAVEGTGLLHGRRWARAPVRRRRVRVAGGMFPGLSRHKRRDPAGSPAPPPARPSARLLGTARRGPVGGAVGSQMTVRAALFFLFFLFFRLKRRGIGLTLGRAPRRREVAPLSLAGTDGRTGPGGSALRRDRSGRSRGRGRTGGSPQALTGASRRAGARPRAEGPGRRGRAGSRPRRAALGGAPELRLGVGGRDPPSLSPPEPPFCSVSSSSSSPRPIPGTDRLKLMPNRKLLLLRK